MALIPSLSLAQNDDCGLALQLFAFGTPQQYVVTEGAVTTGLPLTGFCDPGPGTDDQIYHDVWYCWEAPISGPYRCRFSRFAGGPVRVAVYEGCLCPDDPSSVIACAEGMDLTDAPFMAVEGQEYLFRIGSQAPGEFMEGLLRIESGIPPVTDLQCEPTVSDVLLTWELPIGVTFDSIQVFAGATLLATLDGTATSFLHTPMFPGVIAFQVQGEVTSGQSSARAECVTFVGDHANEECLGAGLLVSTFAGSFYTGEASTEGQPLTGFCDPGPAADDQIHDDLWYMWTATFSGPHVVSVATNPATAFRYALYDGIFCPDDPALVVGCSEGIGADELAFDALAGQEFLIRVGSQVAGEPAGGGVCVKSGIPAPQNLVCTDPADAEFSWEIPPGALYDSINVYVLGSLEATLAGDETFFTYSLPPGFMGELPFSVEGMISSGLTSRLVSCSVSIGNAANDDCSEATPIVAGVPLDFDTTMAGDEYPFTQNVCLDPQGNPTQIFWDVWFVYDSPINGTATFSLCNSNFDTSVAVYPEDHCPVPLFPTELGCDADSCLAGLQSEVEVDVSAGERYLIRVGGNADILMGQFSVGQGTIMVTENGAPPSPVEFLRGDADGNGTVTGLVDGVFILNFQFVPGSPPPPCLDAADVDDNGSVTGLVDGVFLLTFQFVPGSPSPPAPGPLTCGPDPTLDPVDCLATPCP